MTKCAKNVIIHVPYVYKYFKYDEKNDEIREILRTTNKVDLNGGVKIITSLEYPTLEMILKFRLEVGSICVIPELRYSLKVLNISETEDKYIIYTSHIKHTHNGYVGVPEEFILIDDYSRTRASWDKHNIDNQIRQLSDKISPDDTDTVTIEYDNTNIEWGRKYLKNDGYREEICIHVVLAILTYIGVICCKVHPMYLLVIWGVLTQIPAISTMYRFIYSDIYCDGENPFTLKSINYETSKAKLISLTYKARHVSEIEVPLDLLRSGRVFKVRLKNSNIHKTVITPKYYKVTLRYKVFLALGIYDGCVSIIKKKLLKNDEIDEVVEDEYNENM